jgi:hypothetical protein
MTQTTKILNLLLDGAWHFNTELNPISYRYGDRLHKWVRAHGYQHTDDVFENAQVERGLFRYRIRPEKREEVRMAMANHIGKPTKMVAPPKVRSVLADETGQIGFGI